ncbi:MAG: PAS domain S-box protein [Cyanobacteria bacterium P01_G01_bin.54]
MNRPVSPSAANPRHLRPADVTQFARLVHDLAQARNGQQVCQLVLKALQGLLAVDRVLIAQTPTAEGYPVIAEQVNPDYPPLLGQVLPTELITIQPEDAPLIVTAIAAADLTQLQLSAPTRAFCHRFALRSQLVMTIPQSDYPWGILALHHCSGIRPWPSDELQWLQALMPHLALALQAVAKQTAPPLPTPPLPLGWSPPLDVHKILTLIPDVMFLLNRQGIYVQPIHHCLRSDTDAQTCPRAGMHLADFLDPAIAERYLQACAQTLAHQTPHHYEQQVQARDTIRYEEVRMLPYDAESVLVIVRDITAQKLEELDFRAMHEMLEQRVQERTAALRATDQDLLKEIVERAQIQSQLDRKNAELAAIFQAIPDAIVFADPLGRIRRINPAFTRLFGYSLAAVQEQSTHDLTPSEPPAGPAAAYRLEQLESLKPYEITYRRANGETFACETVSTTVTDSQGNRVGYVGVIRDISDRKQAELALKESEARYRKLYENTPVMLHSVDAKGRLISVSNYWLQQMGFQRHEVLGRPSTDFLTPESHQQARKIHLPAFYQQGYCLDIPYTLVRKDGTTLDVLLSAIAERDAAGKIMRSLAVLVDVTERKRAQAALKESEARFRTMADTAPVLIWMADAQQQFTYFNRGWLEFTGRTLAQEQGRGWLTGLHPADQKHYHNECDAAFADQASFRLEFRLRNASGDYRWLLGNGTPRFLPDGQLAGYIGSCIDITTQKQFEQDLADALSQEKELAQITLQSIGEGVITTNAQGRVTYLNPVAAELTGWTLAQARNQPLPIVFTVIHEQTLQPAQNIVEQVMTTGERLSGGGQLALVHRQGRQSSIEESAAPIRDRHGEILGAVLVFRDVTHARTLANQLSWQANHDALTGLMNRHYFEEQLTTLLALLHQEPEPTQQHVLCYLDLDQFKVVNDTCGHIAGDELLRQISAVIKLKIRNSDVLARLGGDEFGILLYGCPLDRAMTIAETIRQAVYDYRFTWQGKTFGVGVSMGLVCLDYHSSSLASLLSAADTACYAAKDKGRNRIMVYQPDDSELVYQRQERRWSVRIRQAIESDRFQLLRQPIVHAHDPSHPNPPHYEVLLRMIDEWGQLIPPSVFIPAAERYDLMPSLDRWVIEHCFAHFANQPLGANQKLAINLSGASLNHDQFLPFLQAQFESSAIAPEQVCFEITETTTIANLNQATRFIGELKALGCHFALDDFGSGMSSFGYLKSLPVDFLKIDGRFIKDILEDPTTYAIVQSINHVGHVIGLKTIAECVENDAMIQKLQEIGVDFLQGYGTGVPEVWF